MWQWLEMQGESDQPARVGQTGLLGAGDSELHPEDQGGAGWFCARRVGSSPLRRLSSSHAGQEAVPSSSIKTQGSWIPP